MKSVSQYEVHNVAAAGWPTAKAEKGFFIDHLLVQIHIIIMMIRFTGLAPWDFE